MTESQIYSMLTSYDMPTPKFASFGLNETPSVDFFPVVIKIESEKVVHKSEFGAVKLNISSNEALLKAKDEIIANIAAKGVTLDDSDKFIVVEMLSGLEVYAGLVDDDIFGKTIVFGKGGVFLEMYKDVCFIDTPGYNPSDTLEGFTEEDIDTAKEYLEQANVKVNILKKGDNK